MGGELGIRGSVAFELFAGSCPWYAPAVALDHDRCSDDPEVDLAATDDRVELNGGQPVAPDEPRNAGSSTESAGLRVERPVVDAPCGARVTP